MTYSYNRLLLWVTLDKLQRIIVMDKFPSSVKVGSYGHVTTTCELDSTQPRWLCADFTTHNKTRLSKSEQETWASQKEDITWRTSEEWCQSLHVTSTGKFSRTMKWLVHMSPRWWDAIHCKYAMNLGLGSHPFRSQQAEAEPIRRGRSVL